jgi:hypothetical protein
MSSSGSRNTSRNQLGAQPATHTTSESTAASTSAPGTESIGSRATGANNKCDPAHLDKVKAIIADLLHRKLYSRLVEDALPGLVVLHSNGAWGWFSLRCKEAKAPIIRSAEAAVQRYNGHIDIDDFLTTHAPAALPQAEEEEEEPATTNLHESARDPHRLADVILCGEYTDTTGMSLLRYWSGTWWVHNGLCYDAVEEQDFASKINASIETEFKALNKVALGNWHNRRAQARNRGEEFSEPKPIKDMTTPLLVASVVMAIGSKPTVRIGPDVTQPDWLCSATKKAELPPAANIIATLDGLVDFEKLGAGDYECRPHHPGFFSPHALPFSIKCEIATPRIDAWQDEVFEEDPDLKLVYQQIWGFLLSGSQDYHHIPIFIGSPRGGEGISGRLLKAAIGARYTAGISLATLGSDFALQQLIGKRLAIDFDARLSTNRMTNATIVDRLLKISSFDDITVNRKGLVEVSMVLPLKLLILSNKTLQFRDTTLTTRFVVVPFKKSWLGKENPALLKQLRPELPGIIRKAARWYHEFVADHGGHFYETTASQAVR